MNTFIQLSNEDIDTALSHDLREEVRRCNKHIAAMQARIETLEKALKEIDETLRGELPITRIVKSIAKEALNNKQNV